MTTLPEKKQNRNETVISERVFELLLAAGWPAENILREVTIPAEGRSFRTDFALLHQLYPIAIVEVTSPQRNISSVVDRIRAMAETLGIPFAFVSDGEGVWPVRSLDVIAPGRGFPSPATLTTQLAEEWGENDLRLSPVPLAKVSIEQALAVTRLMEAVQTNQDRLTVQLGADSNKTEVGFASALKLLGSQSRQRLLYISPREVTGMQTQRRLQEALPQDFKVKYLQQLNRRTNLPGGPLAVVVPSSRDLAAQLDPEVLRTMRYDLVILEDTVSARLLDNLTGGLPQATIIALTGQANLFTFGRLVFSYGIAEKIAAETLQPPKGYISRPLKELAELKTGLGDVRNRAAEEGTATTTASLVGGRDIGPDGQIDYSQLEQIRLEPNELERYRLLPGDILIASWVPTDGPVKLAQIPANASQKLVFANRLNRLRVDQQQIPPEQVYLFLRSDSGQSILKQFAGKTRIAVQDLNEVPIFIPDPAEPAVITEPVVTPPDNNGTTEPATDTPTATVLPQAIVFSDAANAHREISGPVLTLLNQALSDEAASRSDQASERLQEVVVRLQSILATISKKPLSQLVLEDYPTPIALAYRRYLEARFNPYEQVSRLRDVYEAAGFFVYNVVLADRCQRLDRAVFKIEKSDGKDAYKNSAVAARLQFIEKVCNLSQTAGIQKLFLDELPGSEFTVKANKLRELRNNLSHTATQTESQIKNTLAENKPLLEDLLSVLTFLTDYRLVRVPAFYYEGSNLKRQLELYRGTAPSLDEEELQSDALSRVKAHREHLVLLDPDDNMLDLHPLYQLVAHEKTRYVTHLCFLKSRSSQGLQVESVQEGQEFTITKGLDDLNNLVLTL